jgi:hypothetical protein
MRLVHDAHLVARHGADTTQVKGVVRQRQPDGQRIVVTCSAPPSQPLLCRAGRNPRDVAERFVDSPLNRRQTGHGVRAPPGCHRAECTQMTERGAHLQRHGHALDTCLAASHLWRTRGRSTSNPTAFLIALGQVSRAVECSCVAFLLKSTAVADIPEVPWGFWPDRHSPSSAPAAAQLCAMCTSHWWLSSCPTTVGPRIRPSNQCYLPMHAWQ